MNCEYRSIFFFLTSIWFEREKKEKKLLECIACWFECIFIQCAHLARSRMPSVNWSTHIFFSYWFSTNLISLLSRFEQISTKWCKRLWSSHRFINKCNPSVCSTGRWTNSKMVFGFVCVPFLSFFFLHSFLCIGRIDRYMTLFQSCNVCKPQIFQMLSILNLIKFKWFVRFWSGRVRLLCLNRGPFLFVLL